MNHTVSTPICDFISEYTERAPLRMHMPGHKGKTHGYRADITEVMGAGSLFDEGGIISESEENASLLFDAHTFYSTEGSSLAIRAMLQLVCIYAASQGKRPRILAGRNAHKTFTTASAILGIDTVYAKSEDYLTCRVEPSAAWETLSSGDFTALYVTSPDYLGACCDIAALREVCDECGTLLLVDNAHGAYLKFLEGARHPVECGAHMCCDSAHKTLPVLTGGAYLHISRQAPSLLWENAKRALSLFASTSPSFLILRSLDRVNPFLANGMRDTLSELCLQVQKCRKALREGGYELFGDEELKLTVCPKSYGYRGDELARLLREKNIEVEFSDPDHTVMMLSAATEKEELSFLTQTLLSFPKKEPVTERAPKMCSHRAAMSPREAMLCPARQVDVTEAAGHVLADASVGCPPAVPILLCGEIIEKGDVEAFLYYGIESVKVVSPQTDE